MRTENMQQRARKNLSKVSGLITQHLALYFVLCALLFGLCVCAEAQQPTKFPRIAFLTNNFRSTFPAGDEAFRRGLHELGYVEGKNIIIEWRYAEGKFDRLTTLADELIALKVQVIVTGGPSATRRAKKAATIPIVMATDPDPVANGFVASPALASNVFPVPGAPINSTPLGAVPPRRVVLTGPRGKLFSGAARVRDLFKQARENWRGPAETLQDYPPSRRKFLENDWSF